MQGVVAVTREQLSRVRSQLTDQQKEQLGQLWSAESEAVGGATGETVGERVISAGEWERILARLNSSNSEAATMTEAGAGAEAGQERGGRGRGQAARVGRSRAYPRARADEVPPPRARHQRSRLGARRGGQRGRRA